MVDPVLKQVLCPGSESAPKRQRLLSQTDRKGLFGAVQTQVFAAKVPKRA